MKIRSLNLVNIPLQFKAELEHMLETKELDGGDILLLTLIDQGHRIFPDELHYMLRGSGVLKGLVAKGFIEPVAMGTPLELANSGQLLIEQLNAVEVFENVGTIRDRLWF